MAKTRLKKKKAVTLAGRPVPPATHDRRATDLLRNAKVAPMTVDDPYQHGERVVVLRSLRDDPLGRLHNRKAIDEAQYQAGRHWQQCYEIAEISGARAIDPSKEAVDGGGFRDNRDSDAYGRAFKDLCRAAKALGMIQGTVVNDVLAGRMFLRQVAATRGLSRESVAKLFRDALDILAVLYGFAMRGAGGG